MDSEKVADVISAFERLLVVLVAHLTPIVGDALNHLAEKIEELKE